MNRTRLTVLLVLTLAAGLARGPAWAQAAPQAGFTGTWVLDEARSEDPLRSLDRKKPANDEGNVLTDLLEGVGGASGGRESGRPVVFADLPSILFEDDRYLAIRDDGSRVSVRKGSGVERTFRTDGEERELDFGDGPALVTVKRKGARITVSTSWRNGTRLNETWELSESPRTITVTKSVKGRESLRYHQLYRPGPPAPTPTATPAAKPFTAPGTTPILTSEEVPPTPAAAPAASAGAAPGAKPACSIRPPSRAPQAELDRLARISPADAGKRAVDAVAPQKPRSVVSSEVEVLDGCLVFTYILRFADRQGLQEVVIDAGDGKVLSSTWEGQ